MSCFKKIILFCIGTVIGISILTYKNVSDTTNYSGIIKVKNDSIRILEQRNKELELIFQSSIDSAKKYQAKAVIYETAYNKLKNGIKISKSNYEKQIKNIPSTSTDSLYFELSEWYSR